jgi:hypothetical protein
MDLDELNFHSFAARPVFVRRRPCYRYREQNPVVEVSPLSQVVVGIGWCWQFSMKVTVLDIDVSRGRARKTQSP